MVFKLHNRLILIFSLMIIMESHGQLPSRSSDILTEAQEATIAILKASLIDDSSFVFISDEYIPSATFRKVSKAIGKEQDLASFGFYKWRKNETSLQSSKFLEDINKIRKSSKSITLVTVSNDEDFMTRFIQLALKKEFLIWPTRVMALTRLPWGRLRVFQKAFASVNGMVITPKKASSSAVEYGIYICQPYSHKVLEIASWMDIYGLKFQKRRSFFPEKFRKFSDGAHLKVGAFAFMPHATIDYYSRPEDKNPEFSYSGPMLKFLDILASSMNFTYTVMIPPYGQNSGGPSANGSWSGTIGMVLRKDVDFALGPHGLIYSRYLVLGYANPIVMDFAKLLGRRGNTEVDAWSFVYPLTPEVWILTFTTLLAILLVSVTLHILKRRKSLTSRRMFLFNYIRILLQQDVMDKIDNRWQRLILGNWIILIFILIASYKSNLMSLLAVRYVAEPYHSLKSVVDDSSVKMIWLANTVFIGILKAAKSGIFQEVTETRKDNRIVELSIVEYKTRGSALVAQGDHVMILSNLMMMNFLSDDYMKNDKCIFYTSREHFITFILSPVAKKYSPLLGPINEGECFWFLLLVTLAAYSYFSLNYLWESSCNV